MPLQLNNQNDGYYNNVYLLNINTSLYEEIRDLIAGSSGSGSGSGGSTGITTLTGGGHAVVTGTGTSRNITVDLAGYSTTTSINNLLSGKISTTHESYNIGNTNVDFGVYNSTMETITLKNSSGVTAVLSVDLGGNLNKGADGVITVPLLNAWEYTILKLKDSAGTVRNLTNNTSGQLFWNSQEVALMSNVFTQINVALPLTVSGSNIITIDTLWKPSTVTVGTGITAAANDTLGTLTLGLDGTESRSTLKLVDAQSVVRSLTPSITGGLIWNTSQLATMNDLSNYTNTTALNTLLIAKQDTLTAGSNITISNNTISAIADATQAWVTANFLSPLNPGTVGVMQGLSATMTANTFIISVDETTDSRTQFILRDTNNTARTVTANTAGKLLFDTAPLATEGHVTTQLATKQNSLVNYTETTGSTTTFFQGFDDATPLSTHLSWSIGTYTNVPNSHQLITIPVYHRFLGFGSGTCYMTIELKAGTCSEAVFSVNDSTAWAHVSEIKFSNLSSSTWTTVSWSFTIPPNGNVNFHIGHIPPGSSLTQAPGSVLIKNLRLYKTGATSTISSQLNCLEDVICSRTVTATGYASTSDRSIKDEIKNASLDACKNIFDNVDVKTYVRKDLPGTRLGFIAQDVEENLPDEFANLLGMQYGGDEPLLSLDYSRLVCVLWGVCKQLQTRIDVLEQKVN